MSVGGISYTCQNNFYDWNLLVESDKVIDMPLSFFYTLLTFAWYMENINEKRGYSFAGWTDEEMNDPRILRVQCSYGWSKVSGEEKDRWDNRMTSTDWYDRDWSSGKLIAVGPNPFNEDTVFYSAPKAQAEGIKGFHEPYTGPCKAFILQLNTWEEVVNVCSSIKFAME